MSINIPIQATCKETCPFIAPLGGCKNMTDKGENFCHEHRKCILCKSELNLGEMKLEWGDHIEWYTTGKCPECKF